MPRPAPSTVPPRRPIRNEPPPSSRSSRSSSYALKPLLLIPLGRRCLMLQPSRGRGGRLRPVLRIQQRDDRGTNATNHSRHVAHFLPDRALQMLGGVVHAIDRPVNRLVHTLGFLVQIGRASCRERV